MIETRTRRHVCFLKVLETDLSAPSRERRAFRLFEHLSTLEVSVTMVGAGENGAAVFAVDEYDLAAVRREAAHLDVGLQVRTRCARITLVQRGDEQVPTVARAVGALTEAAIVVVHSSAAPGMLAVLVDERDAAATARVLAKVVAAGPRTAA